MYDFGGSDNHANSISSSTIVPDQPTAMSCTFWVNIAAFAASSVRLMVGFGDFSVGTAGWWIELTTNGWRMSIGNGSYNAATAATTTLSTGTMYHLGVSWDGTNVTYYLDGVADGTQSLNFSPSSGALLKMGGNAPTTGTFGAAVDIGHVMWWPSALTADEMLVQYATGIVPELPPALWYPGWTSPGIERMTQAVQTANSTVNAVEDNFDTWIYAPLDDGYILSKDGFVGPSAGGGGGLYANKGLYHDTV